MAHTEQQAIKGPKITSVKPFNRENQMHALWDKMTQYDSFMYVMSYT